MSELLFIGLGTMGAPMAGQLASSGRNISVYDASPEVTRRVAAEIGASAVTDLGAVAENGIVILMLPSSDIVAQVLGDGDDPTSFVNLLAPGTLMIDMGSSRPEATREHAIFLATRGIALVDAPVSGGPRKAETGELTIMVGVPDEDSWDKALPLLKTMGSQIVRTGDVGSAHAVKALNNLLSVIGIVGGIEIMTVGAQFGVDPFVLLEVVNRSTGRNHATEVKLGPHVIDRQWNVGFSLGLTVKDIETALALAQSEGIEIPVAAAAIDTAKAALQSLGPQADQSQIAAFIEERSGVSLAKR